MRIANVISDSIVDGPGLRFTVFTQGCPHHCPGCHNPETHDPAGGREATVAELARARGLNVWAYTGYRYETLLERGDPEVLALLEQVDVLVDGPFVEALKSYSALFRGSTNQRLIDLPKSRAAGRAVLWQREDPLAHFTRPES